ncbi:phosphoesterase, partial [Piptocephalis cylindrospora]
IQHVVVLCMENRSFDHMFGLFDHNPELDGLANYMNTTNAANIRDPNSRAVRVSRGSPYIAPVNPEHDVAYVTEQIFGTRRVRKPYPDPAPMNGFIQDNLLATKGNLETAGHVMQAFTPEQLPVLEQLAREYAVVDRWFSSVPGPTQPNRSFMHSGTAHGEVDNHLWHMRMGYPQKTIYQALSEVKKDWKIYYHDGPSAALFRWMRSPKNLLKLKSFTKNFAEDCREGKLPAYTFIDPQFFDRKKVLGMFGKNTYANDDHPPHDIRRGQDLIKDVYEAVRSSPQWESTLLIITYDEHGGYYDHVPPPSRGVPNPDGIAGDGINYDRLGVRVPTLMISPWIKKGTVFHSPPEWVKPTPTSQYEHSSIPATLHKLFGTNRFLTSRDRWAATLESMWSELSAPRKDTPVELNNAP